MKALMVRTDFSLGESALKAENAVKIAREAGYTAVISADSMNIASVIPLQRAAGDDMAVICGVKLNIVDDPTYEHRAKLAKESMRCMESLERGRNYSFTALIKNEQGYRDICELMTVANTREQFYFVPRLSLEQLVSTYAKGNIILLTSDIGSVFQRNDFAKIISSLITAGGKDNFYSVVYPHPTPFYDQINVRAMKVASALKIEPVAFYPAYYESIDDADIKDIAHMVTNNIKIDQPHRLRIPHQRDNAVNGRRHLLEALKAFSVRMDVPVTAAMASTTQDSIIEACTWRWHELPPALPKMADDEPATLMKLAVAGLRKRLTTKEFGYTPPASENRVYVERLKYEMDTLTRLGFCGYFLMVRDLMNHSRETGIPVGPGRGSSAGSLVAWCIGITNVDPIRHGLLFERFINPERLDLPDADLDFSQARRHEVIEYLNERYGEDYVAGIPNFTYLGAASALRDTARIYGVESADMAVSKELKNVEDDSLPLEELREQLASLDKYATKYPDAFNAACKLQSLMRGFGRHAAGMIVAGVPLTERTPVERRGDARCIAFDKRYCEAMGLIKLDVLGLATLDLLDSAKRYIKENTGEDINLDAISLEDRKVLDGFAAGYTQGVFQLESGPMRKLLKDLGGGIEPMSFKTVVATTALFRPGPIQSGMLDDYVSVAKGFMTPESLHPVLDELTAETNGVILYQEQTMNATRLLAGFTMAEADAVRSAIGKKNMEKMKSMGEKFIVQAQAGWIDVELEDGTTQRIHRAEHFKCEDGTLKTVEEALEHGAKLPINAVRVTASHPGLSEMKAKEIWTAFEKNGAYQFNKSHSVAYSLISYQSMWLKTHYPAEFFAAALTILGEDKHQGLVKDALTYGIRVLPPDVNVSSNRIEIRTLEDGSQALYAPFSAVKGCSENGCQAIMRAREKVGGKFESVAQFDEAVEKRACNSRVRESLHKVGAFASIEPGSLPATDPERLRDQAELMGNLIIDAVKASRPFEMNPKRSAEINVLMTRMAAEMGLGEELIRPTIGIKPKIMIILDNANGNDARTGYFMENGYDDFKAKLLTVGDLRMGDLYVTGVCKKVKDKEKDYTKDEIGQFTDFIREEINLVRPTYILTCGSRSTALFNNKSKPSDLIGRKEYFPELDATVFYGFNPNILYFRPEEGERLEAILADIAETINK
ncbi:DNA polymerase III subunit alpha [Escherichia coli]|uniref:DNA polymerase III subunit alpha n=1 Tax=Escherichia coli TaxID=562 RepID=UPI001BBEB9D5|nr:DNA polymerase III subunit alpha [Escherichia coli]MBY7450314.1 DNA polymerase III subunit alpha [Escherichia coli]HBD1100365.1 DNA polymerase III subunit alpha [Escherichia coli]HDD9972282.1 DNA polymerase III subunit alpha [Escherichia coli]HEA7030451.1 DNA polymerase III subunit alpha [Escherichia coli]